MGTNTRPRPSHPHPGRALRRSAEPPTPAADHARPAALGGNELEGNSAWPAVCVLPLAPSAPALSHHPVWPARPGLAVWTFPSAWTRLRGTKNTHWLVYQFSVYYDGSGEMQSELRCCKPTRQQSHCLFLSCQSCRQAGCSAHSCSWELAPPGSHSATAQPPAGLFLRVGRGEERRSCFSCCSMSLLLVCSLLPVLLFFQGQQFMKLLHLFLLLLKRGPEQVYFSVRSCSFQLHLLD